MTAHFVNRMRLVYGEAPMNKTAEERKEWITRLAGLESEQDYAGISCVFGHIMPFRYSVLQRKMPLRFVTWMRHPVDRAVSQYHHIMNHAEMPANQTLQQRMIREGWTLERFVFCEEWRNFYSQYLWGFPLERFDFIGMTERYREDFDFFCSSYLNKKYEPVHFNKGNYPAGNTGLPPSLFKEACLFHDEDMGLYEQAQKINSAQRPVGR